VTIRNFVLCSTFAGLVGILEAMPLADDPAGPLGPQRILLIAIAAAVIGGTLLAGGSGTSSAPSSARCSWGSSRTA
jgi:simple sugar transport system permease protein